jgi:hypothetical protein
MPWEPMAAERPLWLDEEAEIRALLGAALDRFDRQRGSERQRRIHLAAEAHLESLARADAAADQTWGLVRELQRLGVLSVRRAAARSPYDAEWKEATIAFCAGRRRHAAALAGAGLERARCCRVAPRGRYDMHAVTLANLLGGQSANSAVAPRFACVAMPGNRARRDRFAPGNPAGRRRAAGRPASAGAFGQPSVSNSRPTGRQATAWFQ